MRVTLKLTETERTRLGRSVRRAEKRRRRTKMLRVRGTIRSAQRVCATADAARDEKHLLSGQNQAILPSYCRPLGECRLCNPKIVLQSKNRKYWFGRVAKVVEIQR